MQQNIKRILIFPFNLLSHYLRCIVLAQKYDPSEYEILFQSSPNYDSYVTKHGFKTFSCEQFDPEYVMKCTAKFDFSWLNQADLERIMLAQVSAIKTHQADLVIGDVAPSLRMAAELTGVKYISLVNSYMTKYYAHTRQLPKTHENYKIVKCLPEPVVKGITSIAEKVTFRKVHQPFKDIRKKYALRKMSDYLSETEGDETLICDFEHLFPQKALPDHYRFIGPLIYDNQTLEGSWLSDIDKEKPVICVCMGSTGNWNALRFLNNEYYKRYTIITAGDKQKLLSAPHIISREFVNLNHVLKKADLLICHGGNGTVYSGIVSGVFMLCLAAHFEQEWNVSALERNGYGKSADEFDEIAWREEINNVIERSLIFG